LHIHDAIMHQDTNELLPITAAQVDDVLSTLQDKTPRSLQHTDHKTHIPVLQLEHICNSLVDMNQGPSERNVCILTQGRNSSNRSNARNPRL